MLNSTELISVAQETVARAATFEGIGDGFPDAQLRRAVSTAYYALFHTVTVAAADRFVGRDQLDTPAYRMIQRGFEHRRMREVCNALQMPGLSGRYAERLGRGMVSHGARDFAGAFTKLQDARQMADYDPAWVFFHLDARALIDVAASALQAFDQIPGDEQRDILALMLVGVRG